MTAVHTTRKYVDLMKATVLPDLLFNDSIIMIYLLYVSMDVLMTLIVCVNIMNILI